MEEEKEEGREKGGGGEKGGEGEGRREKQNKINGTTNRTIEIKINKPITE